MFAMFSGDSLWKPMAIGAGGWLTGMDIAPDGTMVARTDTYGAYIWTGTIWKQLVTAESMPDGLTAGGVYEIRIAASNSDILYMSYAGNVYKSVDKGTTWAKTAFAGSVVDPNGPNRMDGEKMAIDPTNPNVVFYGTQKDGLFVTRDGGSTWQKISVVPQGSNSNDPSMTGITIKGSTVYVGTAGSGVYQSNDGGYTWKAIGGPSDISHAAVAPNGIYYATGNTDTALWKYENGAWTKLVASGAHAISIDPFNANHLIVTDDGGNINESKDAGLTWTGLNWGKQLESSNDVPWLETSGLYMSTGAVVFDPSTPGKLWQSGGVGVWSTQLPSDIQWNTPIVWNSQSRGIEQLVANDIIASAGTDPLFASWDRAFISKSDLDGYATKYDGGSFSMGWSVDYASSDPKFMVGISDWWGTENSGFSADGGKTWQKFAGLPTWATSTVGGSIAASTPTNFIWVATGNQPPAYTLDGGKTWTNISIAGISDWSQVHGSYYLDRTTITADRVQPNTFYLYDTNSGVYRTTDGGATWTKMFSGQVAEWSYWSAKLEAVPGRAGELFFTSGPLGSDPSNPSYSNFMHSTDGGRTWTAVAGVGATSFGYGAPAVAGGPASIYIVGKVNGEYGIFYSTDDAQTWTKIGEHPMGSLDNIKTISGDMDKFGLVYVGFGGSGYAYLDLTADHSATTAPTTSAVTVPAPNQVASIVSALDDVGTAATVASGATVNDSTPTFSGTLSAVLATGQKLAVYRDGQFVGAAVASNTSWTYTDSGAADGTHKYTVQVENSAGQAGSPSAAFSLTIDTTAPTQQVAVTGYETASTGTGGVSTMSLSATSAASPASYIAGTINAPLADGETLVVFRDGVKVGIGAVANGAWTFTDSISDGLHSYSAQVQDAAGNLGQMSLAKTISVGANYLYGTDRGDTVVGTSGADVISGVPQSSVKLGKGVVDVLTGGSGADVFVLGDERGRFYDDRIMNKSGWQDYARITDFGDGDKLQLKGTAAEYLQGWISNLNGYSGTGIYHDTNGNGVLDSKDELIALVQNHGPLDSGDFLYV